ncbi:MAG: hypothetical protein ACYC9O_12265, partial [Candidatus Latescibacterota bacterium]
MFFRKFTAVDPKRIILMLLSSTVVMGFGLTAYCAEHYVRQGAVGRNDGSDWTNAWTQLPDTLVRGDTYYFADGTYPPYTFNDPVSGTAKIWIKKATADNHGTNVGWNVLHGDGQALFSGAGSIWSIASSHWVFDGVSATNDTLGHGFKLKPSTADAKGIRIIGPGASASINVPDFLEFRYIEIEHRGMDTGTDDDAAIFVNSSETEGCTDVLFSHCYIHDVGWVHMLTRCCKNWTVEYCYFARNQSDPEQHSCSWSDQLSNDMIVRYNTWADCEGTGIIEWVGIENAGYTSNNWKIFGNLFFYHAGNPFNRDGTPGGTISGVSYHTETNVWFVNNTIVNIPGTAGVRHYPGSADCYSYNNLYYKSGRVLYNETIHDYDYFIDMTFAFGTVAQANDFIENGAVPFIDVHTDNFTLAKPTAPGKSLPSPFNIDRLGIVRGGDAWDRGAYEFLTTLPAIESVTIIPNSGQLKVGDHITITVLAANAITGLTPSPATINGKQVPLAEQGNGVYSGVYTVQEGDPDGRNIEATNVTLTGLWGAGAPASSSGSTLSIDAHTPEIASVALSPSTGTVKSGDTVEIIVTAGGNESGLTASNAVFLGKQAPLADAGNGTYRGLYTIQQEDKGSAAEPDAVFSDDFESGDLSNWTTVNNGIIVGNNGKDNSYGVEYAIASTTQKNIQKNLPVELNESYTSFYLKLDPEFSMADGALFYLTTMRTITNTVLWAIQCRRNGAFYQIRLYRGTFAVGDWTAITRGNWHWIKVHYRTGDAGMVEWWLDTVSRGSYAGALGSGVTARFCLMNLMGLTPSTLGKIFMDNIQVTPSDHGENVYLQATNITLTDAAGNVSAPASSSGSSLVLESSSASDPDIPVITLVSIVPNEGWLKVGDTVTITVYAKDNIAGLTPSPATINDRQVNLSDQGSGIYSGVYTVQEGDPDGQNIKAANITLTGPGGTSAPASSFSSTISVDAHSPVIASVVLSPNSGAVNTGDSVVITVTAANNEIGLSPSTALINGVSIPISEKGNGIYQGIYTVGTDDPEGVTVEAATITLTDSLGNVSAPASSHGSSLRVDRTAPIIASVSLSPSTGTVKTGDTVEIIVTAGGNESGLTASRALFLGKQVQLEDAGNGTYRGLYTIQADDQTIVAAPDAVVQDDFESGNFAKWMSASDGIIIGNDGKTGSHGAEYTITSTSQKNLITSFPEELTETYSSFFLKLDPEFSMADGETFYLSTMRTSSSSVLWSLQLRRNAGAYQVGLFQGGTGVGSWIAIDRNVWHWVKVRFRHGRNGLAEWWLDEALKGSYAGDFGSYPAAFFSVLNIMGLDSSTHGKIIIDTVQVTPTDHYIPIYLRVTGITLTDAAGNVSIPAASTGSTLMLEAISPPPTIASVIIAPQSGLLKVGSTVTITVTAAGNTAGLTPSSAAINGKQIPLSDKGSGIYSGFYTVQEGDSDGQNIEATNITLTGPGGTSAPASSTGSMLSVDAHTPSI